MAKFETQNQIVNLRLWGVLLGALWVASYWVGRWLGVSDWLVFLVVLVSCAVIGAVRITKRRGR